MNIFGKGATGLSLSMVATLFAASSAWAVNCHDERASSGIPIGPNFLQQTMAFIDGGLVSGYGHVIYAVGQVNPPTVATVNAKRTVVFAAFEDALKKYNIQPGAVIVFHSPGGSVAGGFALGRAIREHSLRTSVGQPQVADTSSPLKALGSAAPAKGECDSACSLAFLGGIRRTVPTGSLYGVHAAEEGVAPSPIEPPGEEFYSGEVMAGETSGYLEKMNIDPSWLRLAEACAAGFQYIQYLSPAQLASTKTITAFTTSWGLTDNNGTIVVEGDNPDSSAIPNNHDDLVFDCAGTPRAVVMRVDYLPEAYNAGEHGGVRAAPADFIKAVSSYSLDGLKANSAANKQPVMIDVPKSDVVMPLSVADAHHVTITVAMTPAIANLLKESDTLQFSFNGQTAMAGQVKFDLAEGLKFVNDYSAACR